MFRFPMPALRVAGSIWTERCRQGHGLAAFTAALSPHAMQLFPLHSYPCVARGETMRGKALLVAMLALVAASRAQEACTFDVVRGGGGGGGG